MAAAIFGNLDLSELIFPFHKSDKLFVSPFVTGL